MRRWGQIRSCGEGIRGGMEGGRRWLQMKTQSVWRGATIMNPPNRTGRRWRRRPKTHDLSALCLNCAAVKSTQTHREADDLVGCTRGGYASVK